MASCKKQLRRVPESTFFASPKRKKTERSKSTGSSPFKSSSRVNSRKSSTRKRKEKEISTITNNYDNNENSNTITENSIVESTEITDCGISISENKSGIPETDNTAQNEVDLNIEKSDSNNSEIELHEQKEDNDISNTTTNNNIKHKKRKQIPSSEVQSPRKKRKKNESGKRNTTKKLTKDNCPKKKILCFSSCPPEAMSVFNNIAKRLGHVRIQAEIDKNTTHLVLGGNLRTLKVIVAIARGIWVVNTSWLTQSMTKGHWLDEESFDVNTWFPGATKSRLAHESENPDLLLFSNKTFYIGPNTKFPQNTLLDVIIALGGKVRGSMLGVDICISDFKLLPKHLIKDPPPVVIESWIFDALSQWECPDMLNYEPKQ